MTKIWWRLPGLPHLQDVGATPEDEMPFDSVLEPAWFVGTDGSLWTFDIYSWSANQVPSPGGISRVAVSPDRSKWCVDHFGSLWKLSDGSWTKVDVFNEHVTDVAISADRTIWILISNGRYYSISHGLSSPVYHGVFIPLTGISGFRAASEQHPYGVAWGISDMYHSDGLVMCPSAIEGWGATNIRGLTDLSISKAGIVWMTKKDGSIWSTTDGIAQTRSGTESGFTRVSAGVVNEYAVSADGSGWLFMEEARDAPSVPPPPPPPPLPSGETVPTIAVITTGSAAGTIFKITGSGFARNTQVTVRGARIDNGQIHQVYWLTNSNGVGKMALDIPLPCVPGLGIGFSATDGRPNQADLTDKLWSNTVTAICPG